MGAERVDNTGVGRAMRLWVFALALLAGEYVVALFLFDSDRLPLADTSAFRNIGDAMSLIIAVMTGALLLGSRPSKDELAQIRDAFRAPRPIGMLLVGHLLAYAVAIGVTVFVFNNAGLDVGHPWLWIGLWAGSAICSLLLLVAAVVPKDALRPMARPVLRALAIGLVVGVLAILAGAATSVLWRPMSQLTLQFATFLLEATGHEVVSIPEELIVGTPTYEVFVDRPCSGYEGIGLITVMLGAYLFFSRKSLRFPNALWLLPIGMVLIWVANGIRIAALIAVGTWTSPEIAEGGFHSAAGWLLFCAITLGLVAVSRQSGWFAQESGRTQGSFLTPEGAYLLPLLFLIATTLITGLFSTDFDYLYPLRVLTPLIPLWLFRSYYTDFRWSWSWSAILIGIAVFAVWVGLEPQPDADAAAVIPNALAEMSVAAAGLWLATRALGSTIIVPIAEELAFRGYLLRRLVHADFTSVSPKHFTILSFLVSSVAFGALHGRWLAGILAGMAYAVAQYRRGEISDAIVAHGVTNGLIAAYVLLFGHWAFW